MSIHKFSYTEGQLTSPPTYPSDQLSLTDSQLAVTCPFPSTDFIFYKQVSHGFVFSSDLRDLLDSKSVLDDIGVFHLLQFGSIIPPVTPFSDIKAIIPGYKYIFSKNSDSIEKQPVTYWAEPKKNDYTLSIPDQITELRNILCQTLIRQVGNRNPLVLFSGGVDSSILALLLSDLNIPDIELLHCSYGPDDEETVASNIVSTTLGLPMRILPWAAANKYENIFDVAFDQFSIPHCDHSTNPSYFLSKSLMENYSNDKIIIDGGGADGIFGFFGKSENTRSIYKIPLVIRKLISVLYSTGQFWKSDSTLQHYMKLITRSSYLSPINFVIAQNPLLNIGFHFEPETIAAGSNFADKLVTAINKSNDLAVYQTLIKAGASCTGRTVQKNKSILSTNGYDIVFPFLDPVIFDLAVSRARHWPGSSTPKNTLKHMLLERIPREVVYRKKRGFVAPLDKLFTDKTVLNRLEKLCENDSKISMYLNQAFLKKTYLHLKNKYTLPAQTYNFIWASLFTGAWIDSAFAHIFRNNLPKE